METSRRRYTKVCGEQEQLDFHYSNVIDQNQRQSRFAGHESGLTRKECIGQQLESIPYATNRSSTCDNIVAERKKMVGNSIPPTHMRSNDVDVQANHCANEDNYKGTSSGHDIMSDNSKNDSECSNSSDSICYKNDKSPMHSDEEIKYVSPSDELAIKILKQAEDVFDDFNILKDTFLQKHIRRSKEGYISVRFLASFRKIKALTKNWQDVKYSLQKSKKLVLNENGTKVRRVDPIPNFKATSYARTVVIFNLSTDKVAIEDVQELMLLYGDVVKVSIVDPDMDVPEICSTRFLTYFKAFVKDKSFAIVEFLNYESATAAVSNLKNEKNNPDQIKVVPLISDEYRNQSKPPSSRKQSTIREKGDVNSKERNKNTRVKRSTRNKGKYISERSKEGTSEAENSSSSSDHRCNIKSNRFRSTEEETEFIPPTDELARKIAKQAEDWFDDFTIFKTTFLLNHIRRSKDGFISIKLMASSRKLRALTKDWRAVKYSIRNSTKLELNERETKVRRVDPIPNFEDTKYAKTVVVFNLPMQTADAESVNRLMSLYGSVTSVSIISPKSVIPDICTNRFLLIHDKFVKDKTFAIVEYQEYASAVKATMEHGDTNVDGDDEKLKVVPLMSDTYKNRSNPSTSKSSKTGVSSNESRENKKNSRSINRKTFRKRQMYSTTDTQSSTRDQDDAKPMGKRNPSFSYMKLSPTGRPHQSSTHSFERGSKAKINNNTSSVFSQEDSAYQDTYGAHVVSRQTGGSPIYRNRSNQRVNQNLSPSTQRGSKFSNSVHPTLYETNNLDLYWKKNSRFALDNRMFPRTPYNDFPPYPGNVLSMQSHASRWPIYSDATNRFCGRSQNDSFWLKRSDLLTREYERWKAEFNNAAQFSTISSHM